MSTRNSYTKGYTHVTIVNKGLGPITGSGNFNGAIDVKKVSGILEPDSFGQGVQFSFPSESFNRKSTTIPLYISSSDGQALLGIGHTTPQGNIDIKNQNSSPATILLRKNDTDSISVGSKIGSIQFLQESSSFNVGGAFNLNLSSSGAEIYSEVTSVDTSGIKGKLVFGVSRIGVTSSIDALSLGYNIDEQLASNDVHAILSGSLAINASNPQVILNRPDGFQPAVELGLVTVPSTAGSLILRDTQFNDNGYVVFRKSLTSYISGSSNLGIGTTSAPKKLTVKGGISASGEIFTNTIETISTTIGSNALTDVDTFSSSSYNGAIYDYILKDTNVGARAGQFMVAHDNNLVTFTDTSTKHLSDSTIPEIIADIDDKDIRVRVRDGDGYTFKAFVKKL